MKNIQFYFGYLGTDKWSKFTYWLCNKFTFIPSIEIDLFRKNYKSNNYSRVKHSIYIGFLKYYWRWYKINNKWRFENLTEH